MTASSLTTVPTTAPLKRAPQWWRLTRRLVRLQARLGAWTLGMALVAAVAVLAVVSRAVRPELSAVQFAQHAALWFPFAIAIILVSTYLPVHVASGMTRRSFVRGAVATSVIVGTGYALVVTLMLVVEAVAYERLGWFHGTAEDTGSQALLASGGWTHLWGLVLILVAGNLSGLLVGATYLRFGGWVGTLLLPLTVGVPVIGLSLVSLDPDAQFAPTDSTTAIATGGTALGLLLGLLLMVLTIAATHRVLRDIPVASKGA